MSLRDARIRKARWNPGGRTFELLVRVPADDVDVLFRYWNVVRLEPALPRLAALVEDTSRVIAFASLEESASGGSTHRLRLAPDGEIEIACARMETTVSPIPGQDYFDSAPRFDILSC